MWGFGSLSLVGSQESPRDPSASVPCLTRMWRVVCELCTLGFHKPCLTAEPHFWFSFVCVSVFFSLSLSVSVILDCATEEKKLIKLSFKFLLMFEKGVSCLFRVSRTPRGLEIIKCKWLGSPCIK